MSLLEVVRHPVAVLVWFFGAVASMLHLDLLVPLASTVWASLPNLFTITSVAAFTIAPNVPGIPTRPLTAAALTFAALWVGKLGLQILRKLQSRIQK